MILTNRNLIDTRLQVGPSHHSASSSFTSGGSNPFTGLSIVSVTPQIEHSSMPSPRSSNIFLPHLLPLPYVNLQGDTLSSIPMETLLLSYLQFEDNYICRVDPTPNNNFLIQIQNRLQTTLHLIYMESCPPYHWHSVLEEHSDIWINLQDLLTFLPLDWNSSKQNETFHFVWGSERSGFTQLYLYEYNHFTHTTTLVNPIGDHDAWIVDSIVAIDSKKSLIYYLGNREHPTEKHVYVSPLLVDSNSPLSSKTVRLTQEAGWYQDVVINLEENIMFGVHSSLCSPPALFQTHLPQSPLEQQNSSQSKILFANLTSDTSTLPLPFQTRQSSATGLTTAIHSLIRARSLLPILRLPELHTVEYTHSGQRGQLHCSVLLPDPARYGQGPYPCVVSVYGGPHVQRVANSWASSHHSAPPFSPSLSQLAPQR